MGVPQRRLYWAGAVGLALLLIFAGIVAARVGARGPDHSDALLGCELFFDKRMSVDGTVACATCHQPGRAFGGGKPTPTGIHGTQLTRNPPSLADAARSKRFCWDGRGGDLESLVFGAFLDPNELGNARASDVLALVAKNHAESYGRAFPDSQVSPEGIGRALVAFLQSLRIEDSPFDRYQNGDIAALTDAQKRGLKLFTGAAECSRCHRVEPVHATFSDQVYHWGDIAAELKPGLPQLAVEMASLREEARMSEMARRREVSALGRFLVTLDPRDIGHFSTPSLRNVALTAPYMHDGNVATLQEAVEREVYYRARENTTRGKLTPGERAELAAFLESLSSSSMSALDSAMDGRMTR